MTTKTKKQVHQCKKHKGKITYGCGDCVVEKAVRAHNCGCGIGPQDIHKHGKMELGHTPIPWKTCVIDELMVVDESGETEIASIHLNMKPTLRIGLKVQKANAAFIVRACNSYYDMLLVCKMAQEWYENSGDVEPSAMPVAIWSAAKQAISKAEASQ